MFRGFTMLELIIQNIGPLGGGGIGFEGVVGPSNLFGACSLRFGMTLCEHHLAM